MRKKINKRGLALLLGIFLAFLPAEAAAAAAGPVPQAPGLEAAAGQYDLSALRDIPQSAEISGNAEKETSKKKFELPESVRNFHFDADKERKNLAEAISKLDELGISPEKVVDRLWDFVSRKENREKIGKAAEDLKENAGKLLEKTTGLGADSESGEVSGNGDSGSGKSSKEASSDSRSGEAETGEDSGDSSKNDSGDSSKSDSGNSSKSDSAVEKAVKEAERIKEKISEEAGKKLDETIDAASDTAAELAEKEIDSAAEKLKEEVR